MASLDETHDSTRRSWVSSANGHPEFPLQNLPLGVFTTGPGQPPRAGVAIGDSILDVSALDARGDLSHSGAAGLFSGAASLNAFMALDAERRAEVRRRIFALLAEGSPIERERSALLHSSDRCVMQLPTVIGDYTDFYAGIHHASNVGRLFRADNPLPPNYRFVPIGYHSRASSVCVSGTPVRRPCGQRKTRDTSVPVFGPTERLDFELELGVWIGPGNTLGDPIPIADAGRHVAGFCLLNDWSARDIQRWEYQPLGPFLAKSFATTVSPWTVTVEALAPFRVSQRRRANDEPAPLPYLFDERDQQDGAFDIDLEVCLHTARTRHEGRPAVRLCASNTRHLYWTIAQLVTHHASNGCNLRPGDLFGSGTISSGKANGLGCLLEITDDGARPVTVGDDETRTYLMDGDEIILRAHARRAGFASIGFGEARATVVAAPDASAL